MARLRLIATACIWILMSGCVASPAPAATPEADEQVARMSPPPEVILVDSTGGLGVAFDVDCRHGGAGAMKRLDDARVMEAHTKLLVSIHAPLTSTGVQVGYSLDGGDIVWLPTAFAEDIVQEIPLPAGSAEEDGTRWTFYESQNVKPAPRDCYTGATLLQETIRIVAT